MMRLQKHQKIKHGKTGSTISALYTKNGVLHVGTTDGRVLSEDYTFKSHDREFDYLESTEINEKITGFCGFKNGTASSFLATCNEKSIKLWKIKPEKPLFYFLEKEFDFHFEFEDNEDSFESESFENLSLQNEKELEVENQNESFENEKECLCNDEKIGCLFNDEKVESLFSDEKVESLLNDEKVESMFNDQRIECIETLKNVHTYTINCMTVNNNENYILSSDYLKIYLWCTEKLSNTICVVDKKPERFEELDFVITRCRFKDDSVFAYSTTNGGVILHDLRVSPKSAEVGSFYSCMNSPRFMFKAVTDFKFTGNQIVTRDLESVGVFDVRMKSQVNRFAVNEESVHDFDLIVESGFAEMGFDLEILNDRIFTGGLDSKFYCFGMDGRKIVLDVNAIGAVEHCVKVGDSVVFSIGNSFYTVDLEL